MSSYALSPPRYGMRLLLLPFLTTSVVQAENPTNHHNYGSHNRQSSSDASTSAITTTTIIDTYTPPQCDYFNDDGCKYQVDGVCDAGNACLRDTDCFDCSACAGYHLDCAGCLRNGCVYCPSDGICSEMPLGENFWSLLTDKKFSKKSTCQHELDWLSSTCPTITPTQPSSNAAAYPTNDPLYLANQWIYSLLNVEQVWKQDILGSGVVIRINDPGGVDVTHSEFEGRFLPDASCDIYYQEESIPETSSQESESVAGHGTAVASIALAAHNNEQCAMGIAPEALLSACQAPTDIRDDLVAESFLNGLTTTHISVNSWGFDACRILPNVGYYSIDDDDGTTIIWTDDDDDDDDDNVETFNNDGSAAATTEEQDNKSNDNTSNNKQQQERPQQQQQQQQAAPPPPNNNNCPFNSTIPNNPCPICSEWGYESPKCESLIVEYCQVHYAQEERGGCAEFLDLFVTCGYNTLSPLAQNALIRGITEGRDGKGIIYVFAAGNEHDQGEDINMEGWLHSRFTLIVGAVDRQGFHAPYSTTGAAIFVTGPGGDHNYLHNNIVAKAGGGCMDGSVGTSFSAPAVAGAIALMLEVNSELGWRDVQGIIAKTARQVDPDHFSWTTNSAGLHHSNYYGFGIMDALKAVEAAKRWKNFGREQQLVVESGTINLQIADDVSLSSKSTLAINTGNREFYTESVVVYLQLDHPSRGNLEVTLTSPGGTQSLLHPPHRPENQHLETAERWKLLTVKNFGEDPHGDWTLTIVDASPGHLSDCIDHDFKAFFVHEEENDNLGYRSVDCGTLIAAELCLDGSVLIAAVETFVDLMTGQSGKEACCACGGGRPPTSASALVSWQMVVYGHGDEVEELQKSPEGGSLPFGATNLVNNSPNVANKPEHAYFDSQDTDNEASTIFEAQGTSRSSAVGVMSAMGWLLQLGLNALLVTSIRSILL